MKSLFFCLNFDQPIEKMDKLVNDGNFYEAQQMYKTYSARYGENSFLVLYFLRKYWLFMILMCDYRYAAAQRYSEALDILEAGALIQLNHGQVIFFVSIFF